MCADGDTACTAHPALQAGLAAEQRVRLEDKRPATIGDVKRIVRAMLSDHRSGHSEQIG